MTMFFVFDFRTPLGGVAIYKLVSETPQRIFLEHAGGETLSLSLISQRHQYIERERYLALRQRGVAWQTSDLTAAMESVPALPA